MIRIRMSMACEGALTTISALREAIRRHRWNGYIVRVKGSFNAQVLPPSDRSKTGPLRFKRRNASNKPLGNTDRFHACTDQRRPLTLVVVGLSCFAVRIGLPEPQLSRSDPRVRIEGGRVDGRGACAPSGQEVSVFLPPRGRPLAVANHRTPSAPTWIELYDHCQSSSLILVSSLAFMWSSRSTGIADARVRSPLCTLQFFWSRFPVGRSMKRP